MQFSNLNIKELKGIVFIITKLSCSYVLYDK
jgi:hypothetical protein